MRRDLFINGRFLSQEPTGVQRYADELVKTLDAMLDSGEIDSDDMTWTILAPRRIDRIPSFRQIALRRVGYLAGHLWEQIELPWYARRGLLISLCNAAPLILRRQMVTIHDAGVQAMPGSYSIAFRTWYRFLLSQLGRRARRILTVSHFSRDELSRYIGIAPSRIQSIYHGSEHIAEAEASDYIIDRARLRDRPFLLAVSSLSPRKNFQSIIKAVELLGDIDYDIVIAGSLNPRVFGSATIKSYKRVRRLGYVNDGELKALYRHAVAFVYPSLYEGFGLPPLEAMTCGCPVIVSDIPPHHEVCGEAALYCDPARPDDLAAKIRLIMSDDDLRRKMIEAGLKRAGEFSWRRTTGQFFEAAKELVSS